MDQRIKQLQELLRIEEKRQRVRAIKQEMEGPDFWSDHTRAGSIAQELTRLQKVIDEFDLVALDPNDPEARHLLATLEKKALFSAPYDESNAIVSLHAGAGGTESQDWAAMLLRMYQRYAEAKGWQVKLVDQSLGEEAGIKSATLEVSGDLVYGHLKGEAGVHRLVRISPYDADKARHTSFALVEVIPEVEAAGELIIKPEEVKIDVYRAGGHGGQSVNTTDSAVRLTHLPTGLTVAVQNERSQLQNKEMAFKILTARLWQRRQEEERRARVELRGEHISAEWGNQIRSYVLHPYQMVKDHRTEAETSNTAAVLNGEIDLFVEAYLNQSGRKKDVAL